MNYKNVNNEIIAETVRTKSCARIESLWVLSFGLFFLIKSISKIRHSSLLRHFLRILKFARRLNGLKLCPGSKCFLITNVYAPQHADGGDGTCNR